MPASEYLVVVCDECGFDYGSIDPSKIAAALRGHAARFVDVPFESATRPADGAWSPLEYACHVRDVLQIQIGRVARGLAEETPRFEPMGRDERPARLRYAEQNPDVVREQLLEAASALADVFAGMTDEHLARTVTYNWPEEMIRPLRWVGRHTVHELVHHRLDIQRQLGR